MTSSATPGDPSCCTFESEYPMTCMTFLARRVAPAVCLVAALAPPAAAQVADKPTLTLEGARLVAAAAVREARSAGAGGAIAVVDDGGHLIHLERLDGTFAAAADIAIAKARSAARFKRDTRFFEEAIKAGRLSLVANPELMPLQGGVPILVNGQVAGAIGIAGAMSAQQDDDIARAAARTLEGRSPSNGDSAPDAAAEGHYLPADRVDLAFKAGKPLVETPEYKIHASRREASGAAEIHTRDTDIIYVLEGTATMVTGGSVVDGRNTAEDEIRGASIEGGQPQRLTRGDVLVVPRGQPHWFSEVRGPFLYYVVKVTGDIGEVRP